MSVQAKIEAKQAEMKQKEGEKRDKQGKYRKETWTERFGWFPIIWIFAWGIAAGWGYTYAYDHKETLFGTKTVIIEGVHAQTTIDAKNEVKSQPEAKSEATQGEFTAYNAEEGQTDADPLTMASGKKVYEGAIANNCLPFGTKIKVNGKVKVVEDRMNSRYGCENFDIYMQSKEDAINFGRQQLTYEIL